MNKIDRRTFVQQSGWAGLSMMALALSSRTASADPDPPAGSGSAAPTLPAEPEVYPFRIGGMEAFIIHDNSFSFPGIQPTFAPEATPAEVDQAMKASFLPTDHLALSVNVLVAKARSGVMLFDTGTGRSMGGNAGRLARGLARIGIAPADVRSIFLTHAHLDHIGGLLNGDGKPAFPSAQIFASKTEVDFWLSDAPNLSGMKVPADAREKMAGTIKADLSALKSSLNLTEPGQLTPEVELVAAPGHTPGHAMFRVTEGADKLLVIGDAVHSFALQFPHPDWTMAYDVDPARAVSTRRKLFQDATAGATALAAYHLPFPGLGHVRRAGSGYEWVPRPWVV
jgi:glyoxylase-like metal-dependent hydrolase (beta-lactamase superfamily II)